MALAEAFPQPGLCRAGRERAPHSAAPLASLLGAPENIFSYLPAIIRHPRSDRGTHGTSTLSPREGIRGSARTHTGTESANFTAAFSSPSFLSPHTPFLLPPPLFEPQGVALMGPCVPRAPRGSSGLQPCPGIRAHPGLERRAPPRSRSSPAPFLPPFFPSFLPPRSQSAVSARGFS